MANKTLKRNKRKAPAAPKAPSKRKQQQKAIILTTLAVGATGILGYFGWQYLRKRKQEKNSHAEVDALIHSMDQPIVLNPTLPKPRPQRPSIPSGATERGDDFPLKKGSRGENVRRLQEALIAKYGKAVLPRYGVDGDFGSELTAALKKLGLPTTVTESTLNVLSQGTKVDAGGVGTELYNAAFAKDFAKAVSLLQKLTTVDDYTRANEVFKQGRIGGVRQTIVNGLLNTFSSETQKQKIKFEFLRMGLQFDGNKWSLSGIDGLPLVTTAPTKIWLSATESVQVPARTVLGNEITRRLDYTLFENKGKYFLVRSAAVTYLTR